MYLTKAEAIRIRDEYAHLVGQPIDPLSPGSLIIKSVVIAPHSKILRWKFLKDNPGAFEKDMTPGDVPDGRYNVLLCTRDNADEEDVHCKTVREYLEAQELDSLRKGGLTPKNLQ